MSYKLNTDIPYKKMLLNVTAIGFISGSHQDWETDYEDVKVTLGKTDVTALIEDTVLMEKLYEHLDVELHAIHFAGKKTRLKFSNVRHLETASN